MNVWEVNNELFKFRLNLNQFMAIILAFNSLTGQETEIPSLKILGSEVIAKDQREEDRTESPPS